MASKKYLLVFLIGLAVAIPLVKSVISGAEHPVVEVQLLQKQVVQSSVLASGILTHEEELLLTTEVIGKVTDVYVGEGDAVEKGQLLLQIDDETPQADVERQRAAVRIQEIAIERQQLRADQLGRHLEKQQQLLDRGGLVGREIVEDSKTEYAVALAELESQRESLLQSKASLLQAEDRLNKTRVYAPISGIVTSLDIEVGETAISSTTNIKGSSLMTIANPASIHAVVNIDEAEIGAVEIGQEALIYPVAWPDQPVRGVVDSIAITAKKPEGSQSLSFEVRVQLDEAQYERLRPGMSCRAEIYATATEPVPALPIQAIQIDDAEGGGDAEYFVFLNRDGRVSRQAVKVGRSDDSWQEIVDGLELGDEVIVGPDRELRNLEEGDRITANREAA